MATAVWCRLDWAIGMLPALQSQPCRYFCSVWTGKHAMRDPSAELSWSIAVSPEWMNRFACDMSVNWACLISVVDDVGYC
jgi:hypothetical protein